MMDLPCPFCDKDITVEGDFNKLGEAFGCPHCGKSIKLGYESLYDEETQDAYGYFCLEAA